MPNYGIAQSGGQLPPNQGRNVSCIQTGDSIYLFNAESPTAPQASVAFARGYSPGGQGPSMLVFQVFWAAAPTAVLDIQGSHVDAEARYETLTTFTNTQNGYYQDYGGFEFYRARLVSQEAGGAVTVLVK